MELMEVRNLRTISKKCISICDVVKNSELKNKINETLYNSIKEIAKKNDNYLRHYFKSKFLHSLHRAAIVPFWIAYMAHSGFNGINVDYDNYQYDYWSYK